MPTVYYLEWQEVDPALHPFDSAVARDIAERHVRHAVGDDMSRHAPIGGVKREHVERRVDQDLLNAYGAWAAGWTWAATEPGGGGPVRGWCCAADCILRGQDTGAQDTIERIVGAWCEWRTFLEELSEIFGELRSEGALSQPEAIERAAARLLPIVVERTGAEDAWYNTFSRVMTWCMRAAGEGDGAAQTIESVVSGHFHSWMAPDPESADVAIAELANKLRDHGAQAPSSWDALGEWLKIRSDAWRGLAASLPVEPVRDDSHRRVIATVDRGRDPLRAERMLEALDACRRAAKERRALTFEMLATWQCIVLGQSSVGFRTSDAFAKGGRERYAFHAETAHLFERCIEECNLSSPPLEIRAARAYLDVLFFHPFPDGNSRAARLVLDFILTREGFGLHAAEPLFVVSRAANDAAGAARFAHMVQYLMGPLEPPGDHAS